MTSRNPARFERKGEARRSVPSRKTGTDQMPRESSDRVSALGQSLLPVHAATIVFASSDPAASCKVACLATNTTSLIPALVDLPTTALGLSGKRQPAAAKSAFNDEVWSLARRSDVSYLPEQAHSGQASSGQLLSFRTTSRLHRGERRA